MLAFCTFTTEFRLLSVTRNLFPIADSWNECQFCMVLLQYLFSHFSYLSMQLMMSLLKKEVSLWQDTLCCILRIWELHLQWRQRKCPRCKTDVSEPQKPARKAGSSLRITKRTSYMQNSWGNSFTPRNQELIHKSWHTLVNGTEKIKGNRSPWSVSKIK